MPLELGIASLVPSHFICSQAQSVLNILLGLQISQKVDNLMVDNQYIYGVDLGRGKKKVDQGILSFTLIYEAEFHWEV